MIKINNDLLFGKDKLERVVSVEVVETELYIYQELLDGSINLIKRKYFPWLMSSYYSDFGYEEQKGDLHFKYKREYSDYDEYLIDRKNNKSCWTIYNEKEAALVKTGITYFMNTDIYDISVLSFDIETSGFLNEDNKELFLIANSFRKNGVVEKKLFSIDEYPGEKEMLLDWIKFVQEKNPSIIIGHNIYNYDFPYLSEIAKKHNISLDLGRDGSPIKFRSKRLKPDKLRVSGSQHIEYYNCTIFGREIIDTSFLARKYDIKKKYNNYKLKDLIKFENLEKKDRVFYDAGLIKDNWNDLVEREKIKKYCIDDGDDSLALFDLMIPSFLYLAQMVPKPFSDIINKASGSQINSILIRAYLQDEHSLPKASYISEFSGGISLGNPGVYHNVMKVDVESLYPSIILEYQICDEEKDPKKYFLGIVEYLTKKRLSYKRKSKKNKDRKLSDLEQAMKIIINSAFGFLGTKGLLFNSPNKAGIITEKGREILNQSIMWAEGHNFLIVNADTDSISFCKKNNEEIPLKEQNSLLKSLNSLYPEKISWAHDGYFKSFLVVKVKNYAIYDGGEIQIKGSALKATTKEPALQEMLFRIIKSLLNLSEEDPISIYHEYVKESCSIKDISRWATKKTVTDAVLHSERTIEVKTRDAIKGESLNQGDKFYVFFDEDESLTLTKNFKGTYNLDKMLEKIYKSIIIFDGLLDVKTYFLNYKLKRNKKKLQEYINNE